MSQTTPHRIAFVITELEVGGAERCLTNLALRLDRLRFEPVVYSLWPRPSADQSELVTKLETAKIPVHFIGLRWPRHFSRGSRQLNRLLAEQRPQLLQTFLFHANTIGTFSGWRTKIPHIVQGIRVADRSAWRMMLERISSRFADRIVCVSESVAAMARDEQRLPASKLRVIPNGIDLHQFPAAEGIDLTVLGVPKNRRAITVVGRLHSQKGLDWLLRVAPQVLSQVPDADFVMLGKGPEERALRALADQLQIADRVHFAGWRPDVPAILKSSSLLVLPSRWEGMPNVLLEAMATSLPVVATQAEGVAEVLGPLAEQQTIPFGDDQALVAKISSFLQEPSRALQLGGLNRERVEHEFSLEQMVLRYDQLYRELLEG